MKKFFAWFLCMGSLATYAQQQEVIISAKLDKSHNDTVVHLYEPYSGEVDSARIKDHKFSFKMPITKGGSVYIMQIGNRPELGGTLVYLEPGKMNITGKGAYFNDAAFTGDAWVKEWQEVMDITAPDKGDGKRLTELESKYHAAVQIGDEDAATKYVTEANVLEKKRNDMLLKWLKGHPNSGVAGYVLTVYFNRNKQTMDSLYQQLGEHAKASRILMRYKFPGKVDAPPMTIKADTGAVASGPLASLKVGDMAPAFSIPDVDGKMVSLSDFKGKYVFLDFWASWCGPCKAQVPFLKAANDKFKDKNFVMIGISLDSKKEGWVKGIAKHELSWLNLSSLKGWGESAAAAYGIGYLPSNVLIGPDGKVVARDLYDGKIEEKLDATIR
ncbi:AhpC/TSA family protein [Chitinophaga nivalis]|uniref:AhpC/TSA family protein n=1 Tax=Chitinophaga nivalis TaxID=2991709 RepID=A0ABT3IHJ8_9BACT|nr:AhpC/TSA family protein [Chitinophaga nivalis]MCW3467029.1 AhpC/TSA family protein [Chitinophaga nivalis]MCW3483280.1 AhpC/TSA family protein [Chitinophaga nivalis]